MSKFSEVVELTIKSLKSDMRAIAADQKIGEKRHCYGWWATPNCQLSRVQGDKYALPDEKDRVKFYPSRRKTPSFMWVI